MEAVGEFFLKETFTAVWLLTGVLEASFMFYVLRQLSAFYRK